MNHCGRPDCECFNKCPDCGKGEHLHDYIGVVRVCPAKNINCCEKCQMVRDMALHIEGEEYKPNLRIVGCSDRICSCHTPPPSTDWRKVLRQLIYRKDAIGFSMSFDPNKIEDFIASLLLKAAQEIAGMKKLKHDDIPSAPTYDYDAEADKTIVGYIEECSANEAICYNAAVKDAARLLREMAGETKEATSE